MSKRERSPSWSPPSSALPWMRVDHQPSSLLASMGTLKSPLLQNSAVLTTPTLPSILTAGERTRQDLANTVWSAIFRSEKHLRLRKICHMDQLLKNRPERALRTLKSFPNFTPAFHNFVYEPEVKLKAFCQIRIPHAQHSIWKPSANSATKTSLQNCKQAALYW